MIDRFEPAICGCCARAAVGFGYVPNHKANPIWTCGEAECLQLAKDTYSMKVDEFTRLESLAAGKGGDEGGAYLDEIGKTDLASLTEAEWFEFNRRIVAGYRRALVVDLRGEAPF